MRTNRAILTVFAAVMLAPAALLSQEQFQGEIVYALSMQGREGKARYMAKGNKVRQEMQFPGMPAGMYVLIDMDTRKAQTVMGPMYMEVDLGEMEAAMAGETDKTPPLAKLGTSQTIAGHKCEDYRFGTEMEACIATGMGWYLSPPSGGMGRQRTASGPDWTAYRKEFKDGALPLKLRMLVNGAWQDMMVAESVEQKVLSDDLFKLDPKLQKMPGGMRPPLN